MTTAQYAPSPRWELDSLFPGGTTGATVQSALESVKVTYGDLERQANELPLPDAESSDQWAEFLLGLENADDVLSQLFCYAHCRVSENIDNVDAKALLAALSNVGSVRGAVDVPIRSQLGLATQIGFDALAGDPRLGHMGTYLRELREDAAITMAPDLERLQEELARDGFHAWSRLYDEVSAQLRVTVDRGEGPEELSTEQAKQLLDSPDPALRERVAEAITVAWRSQEDTFAATLNHINGYRQVIYDRRGIDELEIPLRSNRISRDTLEMMFTTIADFRPTMARFFAAKAKLLGLPKLRWFDVGVSIGKAGDAVTYEQAQDFINEHFNGFNPELGDFGRRAFLNQWIEVEDRPGKRQGGFCADVPLNRESRIFMTFGGKPSAVQTLAHELGHAYHNWVLKDLPRRQSEFPSTLAETASTFAESIIREAAYAAASDDEVRLGLLDRKLTDAVAFVMNIPARFHFERAMFKARADHELTASELTELCVSAFADAYDNGLAAHDPMFWASKLHFYITQEPFYNFPYSVGFLFSLGLYARAVAEGPSFAKKYDDTLRLTGYRSCEEVAAEALGVDLTQPDFWQGALDLIAADVDAFEALVG